jgi:hypothetical protein
MNSAVPGGVARTRYRDGDSTARRQIDVAAAFAEELPTAPRQSEAHALSQKPEALGMSDGGSEDVAVDGVVAGAGGYESSDHAAEADADSEAEPESAPVPSLVPLDVVPVLAVSRAEVPWTDLSELATQLLLRVDGSLQTMAIVMGMSVAPNEGARELAALVRRGLLRLEAPPGVSPVDASASELELDLSLM